MKCDTCNKEYTTACDYKQGRCPLHPPITEFSNAKKIMFLVAAPFVIGAWVISNPCKVWEQAKKDLNIK